MTAQEIVTRIQQQLASQKINWRTETVDTFKAGDPATPIEGIATTGMATFSVLNRAAKANRNFVITHEPTFYNHQDRIRLSSGQPVPLAGPRMRRRQSLASTTFPRPRSARWRPTSRGG